MADTIVTSVTSELLNFAKSRRPEPPFHLGTRYDRSGRFLPEPGNTVVCHLVPGSETERALIAARERYLAMPEAPQLAFTPISSLHMTLFQGIIERRRRLPYWPGDIALDTPVNEMTAIYRERFRDFTGGPAFRMQVVRALPTGLVLEGLTSEDRQALKDWRNSLADVFGYRHPDHDSYEFHITFSYVIEWFEDAALPAWEVMLSDAAKDIRESLEFLELRPPAFCEFADMNHFEELQIFDIQP